MKQYFYVAKNLKDAIEFIKSNTDWKQRTNVSFINGNENIVIIDTFMRIRGRHVDGVYIDYSFSDIESKERSDFINRFSVLGVTPTEIKEENKLPTLR